MWSNKNRLPAPVAQKPLRWPIWGLVPGLITILNIDAYSSGVEESNSKLVTYSTICKNSRLRYSNSAVTLKDQSP